MLALRTAFLAATLGAVVCATAGAHPSFWRIPDCARSESAR